MIREREKHSYYEFKIFEHPDDDYPADKWYSYKIYGSGCHPYDDGVIEDPNGYDTEQEARFAAIGHITRLEDGEEPDYDAPTAEEMYQRAHDDKQKTRGR